MLAVTSGWHQRNGISRRKKLHRFVINRQTDLNPQKYSLRIDRSLISNLKCKQKKRWTAKCKNISAPLLPLWLWMWMTQSVCMPTIKISDSARTVPLSVWMSGKRKVKDYNERGRVGRYSSSPATPREQAVMICNRSTSPVVNFVIPSSEKSWVTQHTTKE